jgi:hypothetical protein
MIRKSPHDRERTHSRPPAGTQKEEHALLVRRAHRLSFARTFRARIAAAARERDHDACPLSAPSLERFRERVVRIKRQIGVERP